MSILLVSYAKPRPGNSGLGWPATTSYATGLEYIEALVWQAAKWRATIVRVELVLHAPKYASSNLLSIIQPERIGMHITFCEMESAKITRDGYCLADVARSRDMYVVRPTEAPLATFELGRKVPAERAQERKIDNLLRIYHKRPANPGVPARKGQDRCTAQLTPMAARVPAKMAMKSHHTGIALGELGPIRPITVEMPKPGEPAKGFRNRVCGLVDLEVAKGWARGSSEVTTKGTPVGWQVRRNRMADAGGGRGPRAGDITMDNGGASGGIPRINNITVVE